MESILYIASVISGKYDAPCKRRANTLYLFAQGACSYTKGTCNDRKVAKIKHNLDILMPTARLGQCLLHVSAHA